MKGVDAEFLASLGDILRGQHGSVRGGLVPIGLDFHASSHTADGFAATGITQKVSHLSTYKARFPSKRLPVVIYLREIGDVDESVIEGCEDTCDAENEFTWTKAALVFNVLQQLTFPLRTFADLRAQRDILGGTTFDSLLGRHLDMNREGE